MAKNSFLEDFKKPFGKKEAAFLKKIADREFAASVKAYNKNPKGFYEAWDFLSRHPAFQRITKLNGHSLYDSCFSSEALMIEVVKVNPAKEQIEEKAKLNTATRVWLECGPWYSKEELKKIDKFSNWGEKGVTTHDIALDCGADTFEKAIIELAKLVKKEYGLTRPVAS